MNIDSIDKLESESNRENIKVSLTYINNYNNNNPIEVTLINGSDIKNMVYEVKNISNNTLKNLETIICKSNSKGIIEYYDNQQEYINLEPGQSTNVVIKHYGKQLDRYIYGFNYYDENDKYMEVSTMFGRLYEGEKTSL